VISVETWKVVAAYAFSNNEMRLWREEKEWSENVVSVGGWSDCRIDEGCEKRVIETDSDAVSVMRTKTKLSSFTLCYSALIQRQTRPVLIYTFSSNFN
jgi:hypothetical protein